MKIGVVGMMLLAGILAYTILDQYEFLIIYGDYEWDGSCILRSNLELAQNYVVLQGFLSFKH